MKQTRRWHAPKKPDGKTMIRLSIAIDMDTADHENNNVDQQMGLWLSF